MLYQSICLMKVGHSLEERFSWQLLKGKKKKKIIAGEDKISLETLVA